MTMPQVIADISMSVDGFVAGPNQTLDDPLGAGGMQLHEWAFRLAAWRAPHGLEGGETDVDSALVEASLAATHSVVMGRRMFSGGAGAWDNDPNADGWWGDEPPFHAPVFVVTHHARATLEMKGGTSFTFVTDGVEAAVAQASAAAGDKDVLVSGGASVVQQCLAAGLVDELQLHISPVLLGDGVRLFEQASPGAEPPQSDTTGGRDLDQASSSRSWPSGRLEIVSAITAPFATHIRYRVLR
jgi:dihydrofolate reductase